MLPLSSWLVLVSYLSMICRTCSLFSGGYRTSFSRESRCLRLMKSMNRSREMNGFPLEPLQQRRSTHMTECIQRYRQFLQVMEDPSMCR